MRGRIIIASPRNPDVFGHHGFAFFLELLAENFFQRLETDAHHVQAGADRQRVLRDLVSRDVRQLGNRERTKLHSIRCGTRLYRVSIVDTGRTAGEQLQMPVHGVLVQRDEQVEAVTHVGDFFRSCSNRQ